MHVTWEQSSNDILERGTLMQPDPTHLLKATGITTPLIGFYDVPDPAPFAPLIVPKRDRRACVFAFYARWLKGETLYITPDNPGCGGAGRWLCSVESRSREDFIHFLVEEEGLKASGELMNQWLDHRQPYRAEHPHLLLGPLKAEQYESLKTVTFFVSPDQLSALVIGAHYHVGPEEPPPVIAPFGSGCMQLVPLFRDLAIPQAIIGATDLAMRQYLPPDILAFTVTRPMFKQLCRLDERSSLF